MTNTERDNDAGLVGFLARLDWANTAESLTAGYAVIGLTNFGEWPVPSTRLAQVLGWPVSKVEAIVSSAEAAHGWLAAHPGGRVFPVRDAWVLSFHRVWRDRMSALLNPGN